MGKVDKVRASRDGHEFHEIWVARKALQLLLPDGDISGIAVEGLSPVDQSTASAEAVEIADVTVYRGGKSTFESSTSITVTQFKYSISRRHEAFRNSAAKKTISKLAATYREFKLRYSASEVSNKLYFELITNRPIYLPLLHAITSIAESKSSSGETRRQSDQFVKATGLDGEELKEFASKFRLSSTLSTLRQSKSSLACTLNDWSAAASTASYARFGVLTQLVREKAGGAGDGDNVIGQVDVLAALGLSDHEDLFPCPACFPVLSHVVARQQLEDVVSLVSILTEPLLIHASGGVGKTVFLQSLAQALSENNEVVLFDCFGGGAYRAPEDSRHLPERGLVHLANELACRGLCDPMLPGGAGADDLTRTFRRRLEQCSRTIQTKSVVTRLVLIIDAVDNAILHAKSLGADAFPTCLLESFQYKGGLNGISLVVSCRTERIESISLDLECYKIELQPFDEKELEQFVRKRFPDATLTELVVARARSGGNARILEHLLSLGRGGLGNTESTELLLLDDLLDKQIEGALREARLRGCSQQEIDTFLAGLSVLPPPVPIEELACTHNMNISVIRSFAADLAPLMELVSHGIIFRDEPTETKIRETYSNHSTALLHVVRNIDSRQLTSVYSARALPHLLRLTGEVERLYSLALTDDRIPNSITSNVGRQKIRHSRLIEALRLALEKQNHNKLIPLMIELSTVEILQNRTLDYVMEYPELVACAKDKDATRMIFESRTAWPGKRHARLSIVNLLFGDQDEAYRHMSIAQNWVEHYFKNESCNQKQYKLPEPLDVAAVPFCLYVQDSGAKDYPFARGWKDWYGYKVASCIFRLLEQISTTGRFLKCSEKGSLDALTGEIGFMAAAISGFSLDTRQLKHTLKKLSNACRKAKRIELERGLQNAVWPAFDDALRKAAALALPLNLLSESLSIVKSCPQERPNLWNFRSQYNDETISAYLVSVAIAAGAQGRTIRISDLLPAELTHLAEADEEFESEAILKKSLVQRLRDWANKPDAPKPIGNESAADAERFVNNKLVSIWSLSIATSSLLCSNDSKSDQVFLDLLEAWRKARNQVYSREVDPFMHVLGRKLALFALWSRPGLSVNSVLTFVNLLHEFGGVGPRTLIEVVNSISKRDELCEIVCRVAVKAKSLIDMETEVKYKGTLYAELGRAILPVSHEEAGSYFKIGLEQMEAIGSEDYGFLNELLKLCSVSEGEELSDEDAHTLSNLCELNLPEDEEKLPWHLFASGLACTVGSRALAKLGRWADRERISLDCSLLPYLVALLENGKLEAELALALLSLSNPVELYVCNTKSLIAVLDSNLVAGKAALLRELVAQYLNSDSYYCSDDTTHFLASTYANAPGCQLDVKEYLRALLERRQVNRDRRASTGPGPRVADENWEKKTAERLEQVKLALEEETKEVVATSSTSIEKVIRRLSNRFKQERFRFEGDVLHQIRTRVKFNDRSAYLEAVAKLKNARIYTKLNELESCKMSWADSSIALNSRLKDIGIFLVRQHAKEFVDSENFSELGIERIGALTGTSSRDLALEIVKELTKSGTYVSASCWLGLSVILEKDESSNSVRESLIRLLRGKAALLSRSVLDGEWTKELYPQGGPAETVAGLIWLRLGDPVASERWRAAHSIRCLARFGKWDVINSLVENYSTSDAGPFQAPELKFFFLHARLWLLMALARLAHDYPVEISSHKHFFERIAFDTEFPHVLLRHFAAQTLIVSGKGGGSVLQAEIAKLETLNRSSLPVSKVVLPRDDHEIGFGHSSSGFHFDYDFDKYDLQRLCQVFGTKRNELRKLVGGIVRTFDESVNSMHDSGGRELSHEMCNSRMTSEHHTYGQHLAWHALMIAGGQLLEKNPVIDHGYQDDPWGYWLESSLLTRADGRWLSDCLVHRPVDTIVDLLEETETGPAITGDQRTIMELVHHQGAVDEKYVLHGQWRSIDSVRVHIRSALVKPKDVKDFIQSLIDEIPCRTSIPVIEESDDGEEIVPWKLEGCKPWITFSEIEARLDRHDPHGTIYSILRPRFSKTFEKQLGLVASDKSTGVWKDASGKEVVCSEAWHGTGRKRDDTDDEGVRMLCSSETLRSALSVLRSDLVILVNLERFGEAAYETEKGFSNTVAVIRVTQAMKVQYFPGVVSHHALPHY